MTRTAVIIVSWNSREDLESCLASLANNIPGDVEILVVDNGSTDGTPDMVSEKFPKVRLFPRKENLGFARANNLACSHTRAEYLFILNPDTVVRKGALETLTAFLDRTPDAGLAAPLLIDEKGFILPSAFRFPGIGNYWTEHSILLPVLEKVRKRKRPGDEKGNRGVRELDWATGAAFMVRRSALEGEPLFDERFFMYSEDADLCRRLANRDRKRHLIPSALVMHIHRGSSRQARFRTIFHLFRSLDMYHGKHKGPVERFFLRASICMDMLIRIFILTLFPGKQKVRQDHRERKRAYREIVRRLNPFRLLFNRNKG